MTFILILILMMALIFDPADDLHSDPDFHSSSPEQAIRELTGRYFAQVSHRVKKKLAMIYKHDFLMFGYNPFI